MAPSTSKKRRREATSHDQTSALSKKSHKRRRYSSSSSANDDFAPVDLSDSDAKSSSPPSPPAVTLPSIVSSSASSESEDSSTSPTPSSAAEPRRPRKRNDPAAFSTSISKILSSKLSTAKRADPVLARSATAALANSEIADAKLEAKARRKLKEDRKLALEKGRVRDVLLGTDNKNANGENGQGTVGEMQEEERRLRKTAQRGVVKLFNAVRAAQMKGEEAAKKGGTLGRKKERVDEMSKKGFLELTAGDNINGEKSTVEEA